MKKLLIIVLLTVGYLFPRENIAVKDFERINVGVDGVKHLSRTRFTAIESISRIGSINFGENSQARNNIKSLQNSLNSILSSSIKTFILKGDLTRDDIRNILSKTSVIISNKIGKNYGVKLGINTPAPTGRYKDE